MTDVDIILNTEFFLILIIVTISSHISCKYFFIHYLPYTLVKNDVSVCVFSLGVGREGWNPSFKIYLCNVKIQSLYVDMKHTLTGIASQE